MLISSNIKFHRNTFIKTIMWLQEGKKHKSLVILLMLEKWKATVDKRKFFGALLTML